MCSPGPSPPPRWRALEGDFRLLKEIGRGGMGVVYLAEDTHLERRVAIKTLPTHLGSDAAVRQRFLREARTAASLSHPNIVSVYSAAERQGIVYFAMGYVHGESLAERIQRLGPLPLEEALHVTRQLALALATAHAQGVVHRDIKAENVLLDAQGRALVTDFGIARLSEAQPLTATGTVLGTVQYMSPEQVIGESVDGRSDLYAMGVLLFYMLSGRFPFERAAPSAVLVAHVNSAPLRLHSVRPDLPDGVDALVQSLLEKHPDARVPSAGVLLERLQVMEGTSLAAVPSEVPRALPPGAAGRVTPSDASPQRLSSVDADAVWARAAELQAYTGAMIPPAVFPQTPAASATAGYDAALVMEAAREAGIEARYVERAFAERALTERAAGTAVAVQVATGPSMQRAPNRWIGAHTKIEFESVLDGEIPLDLFEDLADIARRSLGDLIAVSVVGRTLAISIGAAGQTRNGTVRLLQITVGARNGRTSIRAFEDITGLAGGLYGGIGAGLGLSVGPVTAAMLAKNLDPLIGIVAGIGILSGAVAGSRFAFRRASESKQRELRALVEELARFAMAAMHRQALPPASG